MEEPDSLKFKNKTFFKTLRDYSMSQEDPIPEWRVVGHVESDGSNYCICTTPIMNQYTIENKENGRRLVIGSECVKRWNIEFTCKECGAALGNITQRLLKNKFICPSCTREAKRRQRLEEARKEARERELANYRLYWYGPYYQRRFSEVIDDIAYVEALLNAPNKTKSLQMFEEYASLVYDIEETHPTE